MGLASGYYNQDGIQRSLLGGVDVFRNSATYGLLQQGFAPTDITGTVIKDVIKYFVQKGDDYYGYGADGYLYKFTGTGLTPSELDHANLSGRVGGNGLAIYHDGTSDKLHYFAATTVGTYDFATTYNNSYKTGLQSAPHPAKEWQGVLYFGNGRYVGSINGTTENLTHLTLPIGYEVQDIDIYNGYLAILAHKATGTLNTDCKLFLWDGYTTSGCNGEYVVPEKAYSLEKYKDGLAIFGYKIRLFGVSGYTNFEPIHTIKSTIVYPGQTCYSNNMLYWQEYTFLGSFGSPDARIKPTIQSPLYPVGTSGAIINLSSNTTEFCISTIDKNLFVFNSGYGGGRFNSVWIDLPVPSKLTRVTIIFTKLTAPDGFQLSVIDDDDSYLLTKSIGYATLGAIRQKSYALASKLSNCFRFTLNWTSGYTGSTAVIKKIIFDYEPSELKE